jgi:pyruvate dehydrogenase complex dehydrogenase (E1) component
MTTPSLTEKIHAQQIRKKLLNGYPSQSGFCELMARISDEELLQLERVAHQEKLAWLAARRAERDSPFNRIVKKAMSG